MRNFIAFSAAIVVGACSATTDPMSYSVGGVGIANRTSQATVIASKSVMIDLSNGEAGQGGLAGAMIVGASNSGSDAGGVVAAILVGAIVGAAVGAAAEDAQRTPGVEYQLRMDTGALLTFIQPGGEELAAGSKVTVIYGPPARLLIGS